MKKIAAFTAILSLVLCPQFTFAQTPLAPAGPPQLPADMIGVIAAVKGDVEVVSSKQVGRIAGSGAPIFLGDVIHTDDEGHLQILLLDQTVFTIGKNSSLVIDEFVYDPATNDGKIDVRILEGAFRYISGKIPTHKPDNVDIKLPSGSVGIRGTILYGNVSGSQSKLLLLGPGENNNTQHTRGKIMVNNEVNGTVVSEVIKKSGYGSEIKGENIPPTPAYRFSPAEVQEMITPFGAGPVGDDQKDSDQTVKPAGPAKQNQKARRSPADSGGKSDQQGRDGDKDSTARDKGTDDPATMQKSGVPQPHTGMPGPRTGPDPMMTDPDAKPRMGEQDSTFVFEGSAGDAAGQTRVDTLGTVDVNFESTRLDFETDDLAQDTFDKVTNLRNLDGVTKIEDLITYQAGSGYFSVSSVAMTSGGSFGALIEVHFDSKEIGGGTSNVNYSPGSSGIGITGSITVPVLNYSASSGAASFNYHLGSSVLCGSGCTGDLNLTLNSGDTRIVDSADISLTVNDGSSQSGTANSKGFIS